MPPSEDPSRRHFSFGLLNYSVGTFEMHFDSSECELLLQDRIGPKPNLAPAGRQLGEMNRFNYFEHAEGSGSICQSGTTMASVRHPVIDQRSSVRSNSGIGATLRLR